MGRCGKQLTILSLLVFLLSILRVDGAVGQKAAQPRKKVRQLQEEYEWEEEEDEESLPEGVRLKNAPNKSIELLVLPSWNIFLGFSDRRKVLEGRLTIIAVYENIALDFVENPHQMIDVENFGDGEKRHMATLSLNNPTTGVESSSTSTVYIGDFAQATSPMFDMKCFPFDRKQTLFRITLQKPGELVFALSLGCVNGVQSNSTVDGKVRTTCTWSEMGTYVGFEWSNWTCTQMDNELIICSMDGIREWGAIFNSYMWPSLIFTMMGFLSFTLDVKMSMPRVATTMLALVSLTSLRNSVVATLPASGSISWLEEYFLVSKTFMFLNLAGHAISFYLDATGRKGLQRLANKCNFFGMLWVLWLIVFARLHVRQCELVDSTGTGVLVAFLAIGTVSFYVSVFVAYRSALKESLLPTRFLPTAIVPAPGAAHMVDGKGAEDD